MATPQAIHKRRILDCRVERNRGNPSLADVGRLKPVVSKKIRNSARGEVCTMNVAGVCNMNSETTVLAHFPSEIAGYKSTDLSAGYACATCHDWIDRRTKSGTDADREFYMRRSQIRTLHRLIEKGIVTIG